MNHTISNRVTNCETIAASPLSQGSMIKINPADLITFQQIQQHKVTCDALNDHTMLALLDEAHQYQPIIVSVFIAYKDDVSDPELAEMIKILLLIWLCFRDQPNIKLHPVSHDAFYAKERLHNDFRTYWQLEHNPLEKEALLELDIERVNKVLLAHLFHQYTHHPVFQQMEKLHAVEFLLQCRTLLECFEAVVHHTNSNP